MSRAEDYITQNTKTLEEYGKEYFKWLTPDQARRAVDIAKEEVIEKVCEFLENDLCCYIEAQNFTIEHLRLENDLKDCLKK